MASKGSAGLGMSVCVVGAGALGLVAVKNFVEQGFDVTCFERNTYVGGIWHISMDEKQTSTLDGTICNVSKQGMAFSDFPFPEETPLHPTAKQMQEYMESYAAKFNMNKHIQFSTSVKSITRDDREQTWKILTTPADSPDAQPEAHTFDRLIIASGAHSTPAVPKIKNIDAFKGEVLHSQSFKDPSKYAGKRVLIVGLGNSTADSVGYLAKAGASKIYVSHRTRIVLLPRLLQGKAMDHSLTMRLVLMLSTIRRFVPSFANAMTYKMMRGFQNTASPALQHHKSFAPDRPSPNTSSLIPVISDILPDLLMSGVADTVKGISHISGPSSIILVDSTVLENIDVILFCTGLHADFSSLIPSSCDPCNPALAPDNFAALPSEYRDRVPRLYRGIISLQHPHALAFLGHSIFMRGAYGLYDLITMALAQIWSSNFALPSQAEMEKEASAHYATVLASLKNGPVAHTGLHSDIEYDQWLNKAAGTGIYERVGSWTSWECWGLWWRDRELYRMMIDGVLTAHSLRLFDTGRAGGRKVWDGARGAVEKANAEVRELERVERERVLRAKAEKKGS